MTNNAIFKLLKIHKSADNKIMRRDVSALGDFAHGIIWQGKDENEFLILVFTFAYS